MPQYTNDVRCFSENIVTKSVVSLIVIKPTNMSIDGWCVTNQKE